MILQQVSTAIRFEPWKNFPELWLLYSELVLYGCDLYAEKVVFKNAKSLDHDINYVGPISVRNVEYQAYVDDVLLRMNASSVTRSNFAKWVLSSRVAHVL